MRATAQVQIENDWARVTEWRFAPGAETGYHVHQYDYIVVPMTSGLLRLEDRTGSREVKLTERCLIRARKRRQSQCSQCQHF